jgi:hypothetical protein
MKEAFFFDECFGSNDFYFNQNTTFGIEILRGGANKKS